MAVAHEIALPAALSSLSPLAEWLAQQMASLPVAETWRFALDLAACETATNNIAGVTLRFPDAGTPFPAERLAAARNEAFGDDTLLAESGRGLRLILLSVDSFDLERRDGKNIAVLEKGW